MSVSLSEFDVVSEIISSSIQTTTFNFNSYQIVTSWVVLLRRMLNRKREVTEYIFVFCPYGKTCESSL